MIASFGNPRQAKSGGELNASTPGGTEDKGGVDRGGVVLNPSRYVFGVETQSFPVRVGENNLIAGVSDR